MSKQKSILYVNWGTPDKEYTFKAAKQKEVIIYLATLENYPKWINKYVPKSRIIIANTYDSAALINSVVKYMDDKGVSFDSIITFFEMNIIQTAELAEVLGLPFLKSSSAKKSSANKLLMRFFCEKNKIPTPKFTSFSNLKEGLAKLKSFSSPVVIKAVHSGHSYGVMKVEGETKKLFTEDFIEKYNLALNQLNSNFDEWMEYSKSYKGSFILEEYFEGTVFSVDGIIQNGKVVVSVVTEYESTEGPHLLQNATIIPSTFSQKVISRCKREASRVMKALEFDNCGFHIEMRLTKDGAMLLEAAARPPGGKILDAYKKIYGFDMAGLFLDLQLGRKLKKVKEGNHGYRMIEAKYASKSGVVIKADNKINILGFKLLFFCKIGDFVGPVFGIPSTYLYYQIDADSWEELNIIRKKVGHKFKVIIETREFNHFLGRLGWFKKFIPNSIKNNFRSPL